MKLLRKRKSLLLVALLALVLVFSLAACGDEPTPPPPPPLAGYDDGDEPAAPLNFPLRDVRAVVPFSPGGSTDAFARILAANIDLDGVHMVVVNIEGGLSAIGSKEVYHSPPDGYTILVQSIDSMISNYMTDAFTIDIAARMPLIAIAIHDPHVIAVAYGDTRFDDLIDVVDYAKANPGALTIAGFGIGSMTHLAAVTFMHVAEIDAAFVPFDGGAPARNAVLGGHADVFMGQLSDVFSLHLAGEFRIIGLHTAERHPVAYTALTTVEQGFDLVGGQLRGYWAPPGTPPEIVAYLEGKIREAYNSPDFQEAIMRDIGVFPEFMNSADGAALLQARIPILRALLIEIGLLEE